MKITDFIRNNRIALVCCAAALSGGFMLGLLTAPKKSLPIEILPTEEPTLEHLIEQPAENVSQDGDISILPTTDVLWLNTFTECVHEYEIDSPGSILGLTESEITEKYPDFVVSVMTPESVRIERQIDGFCQSHLLLKSSGDNLLCIFRTDSETFVLKQESEIPFDLKALDPEVQAQLSKGIIFTTEDEINAFLEDKES